jgi:hypothetical protein
MSLISSEKVQTIILAPDPPSRHVESPLLLCRVQEWAFLPQGMSRLAKSLLYGLVQFSGHTS